MTKNLWLLLVLFLLASASLLAVDVSVYDIQHTTIAGDGTYPSLLNGQQVRVTNVIVTAKGYSGSTMAGDKWFVADPAGGPWSGLYVYDFANAGSILVGDLINVTGTVTEYYGLTELGTVTGVEVISHGNPVPAPVTITTGMLTQPTQIEQYEGVLVQVQNVRVTNAPSATYYEWYVTDNSGPGQIDDGFIIAFSGLTPTPYINETWVKIRGIIDYGHNEYAINPRFLTDMIQTVSVATAQITINPITAMINSTIDIPILTTALDPSFNVTKFSFALKYDPQRLEIESAIFANTILDSLDVEDSLHITTGYTYADTVYVTFSSDHIISSPNEVDTLLILRVKTKMNGTSPLTIFNFKYNNTTLNAVTSGSVNIPVAKMKAFMNVYNPTYVSSPNYKLNQFDPKQGKIRIDFGGKTNEISSSANFKGILRIYDSQGRLVNTIFNEIITSPTGITYIDWDGRNSEMNLVPIGLYYCQAEIIDRASGDRQTTVQPIVVGTPLKSLK